MRIHDIEIYSSKQIRAFIIYLEALAEDREANEKQQAQWATNSGQVGGALQGLARSNA